MHPGKTYAFTYGKQLFFSVLALFLLLAAFFIVYQHLREKEYKVELTDSKLQDLNTDIQNEYSTKGRENIAHYISTLPFKDLRVTIISVSGDVIYESIEHKPKQLENHIHRKEVQQAIEKGRGKDVRRLSETTGIPYFYSATLYENHIVRTAVPYSYELTENLKTDHHYIWFALISVLILIFIFYKVTNKMGTSINLLRQFAIHIERNQPYDKLMEAISGNDELSEISQHIIQIYQRLHDTKEALYIEREKLIAHLQTAQEGLGVFKNNKEEILVNNLFTQYANLISDDNLETTESIFAVPEFYPVTDFIEKTQKRPLGSKEKRMSINIHKNGRVFMVKCIIFQDMSFEISINDISMEEEQTDLKRQLTQNIAHELKTPVSSIQAYLETIVTNPNITPEKAAIFLDRCYEQSKRLSRLLRDISVLTRMDEAANMIEMEKVNITNIVNTISEEVALELEKKQIVVVNQLKENIEIKGNFSLVYSIFRNLTDNAIAYAGNHIQIIINCFREDEFYYYFSFADTGVGIAPEHLQRLFERFYRIDKGRSRKLGGTGLGLAIVKNAILIHGGNISAKKYQEGGLEFVFTLSKENNSKTSI